MADPYRTPADISPDPKSNTSTSWPGPEKWRNDLWRRFFDLALGGCVSGWNDTLLASYAPLAPSAAMVDRAEGVADEAWRRAFLAGANPVYPTKTEAPAPIYDPSACGPWFLASHRTRPTRFVVCESSPVGTLVAELADDGQRTTTLPFAHSKDVLVLFEPIEPVSLTDMGDGTMLVWTLSDYVEAAIATSNRGEHDRAQSYDACADRLRATPLPKW